MNWWLVFGLCFASMIFWGIWFCSSEAIIYSLAKRKFYKKYKNGRKFWESDPFHINLLSSEMKQIKAEIHALSKDKKAKKLNSHLIEAKYEEYYKKEGARWYAIEAQNNHKEQLKSHILMCSGMDKYEDWVPFLGLIPLALLLLSVILYVIGWLWYYVCGGHTLHLAESFLDYIVYGAVSIGLLIYLLTGLAILFGWKK